MCQGHQLFYAVFAVTPFSESFTEGTKSKRNGEGEGMGVSVYLW